jgi:hypothetical protein
LKVELHNRFKDPLVINATRVLVTSDDGTPLSLTIQYAPRHYRTYHAGEADFAMQLRAHGIDKTVLVSHIDPKRLTPLTLGS